MHTLPHAPHLVYLIFLLTYGGGLVGGDAISVSITLAPSTRLALVTQGSTKLFKSSGPDVVSRQSLEVKVGKGAGLCYLPDPTQPFSESRYEQKQVFEVEEGGSVAVLDWVSEGRRARGEVWGLERWVGRNEVWSVSGEGGIKLMLRDNVVLDAQMSGGKEGLVGSMDGLGVFGTLILKGPLFEGLGKFFLDEFRLLTRIGARNWGDAANVPVLSKGEINRVARHKLEKVAGVLWTAASVRGLVLVKFGASQVEGARKWLGSVIKEERSIQTDFGEGALIALRD